MVFLHKQNLCFVQGKASNPGVNWAALTGDNFTAQHAPAAIDFAAFHYW